MDNTTWNDSRFGPGSYEYAAQEDRSAPRVPVRIAARLRAAGARDFATQVRDMSLGGFTATAPAPLAPQTPCWLTIPGFAPIAGEVAWAEPGIVGIAFASLIEQDMFNALVASGSA